MSFFTNLRADRLITEIRSSNDAASPALLKAVARLTLWDSLKSVRLSLWCERREKLVTFKSARDR